MRVILRATQALEADLGSRPTTSVRIGRTPPDNAINTEAAMNLRRNLRGQSPAILTIVLQSWTRRFELGALRYFSVGNWGKYRCLSIPKGCQLRAQCFSLSLSKATRKRCSRGVSTFVY
jgi:hypothetical protein